jgi:hypothetical protein
MHWSDGRDAFRFTATGSADQRPGRRAGWAAGHQIGGGFPNKDAKGRAERLAIFVGLWPPTFFLLGKVLQDLEATPEEQVAQARLREAA